MQPESQYSRYPKVGFQNRNFSLSPSHVALKPYNADKPYLSLQDKHDNEGRVAYVMQLFSSYVWKRSLGITSQESSTIPQ
jgi:hypothetical protein